MPRRIVYGLLVIFYLFFRFTFLEKADEISIFLSPILELIFAFLVFLFIRDKIILIGSTDRRLWLSALFALIAGWLIFSIGALADLLPPMDFKTFEVLVMLLILAPIVEESVFRLALWGLIEQTLQNKKATLVLTTFLFSFSHFFVIFFLPSDFYPFIIFQTIYTFALGGWAGYYMYKGHGFIFPLLVHFLFNFGFFLGAVL
jgi:membrane protease YdiL (CAAX protease family)